MTVQLRSLAEHPAARPAAERPPLWLAATCGMRVSEAPASFSWCELGCLSALGAVINAATNPGGRFVVIDPQARRLASGRVLAEAAGINNLVFLQAPFAALALDPCERGPLHDYILVSQAARASDPASVRRCIAHWLKPGGTTLDLEEASVFAESSVRLLGSDERLRPRRIDPAVRERCARLNRVLARGALDGADHAYLAAPGLGSALPADLLQMAAMLVLQECPGVEGELLQEMVRIVLRDGGLNMGAHVERRLECFERLVLPHWRRLGMLPAR